MVLIIAVNDQHRTELYQRYLFHTHLGLFEKKMLLKEQFIHLKTYEFLKFIFIILFQRYWLIYHLIRIDLIEEF